MLNKNLNYTPNSLLHKIDFLNKYNLHTPFTVPKIEKIKFTVLGRLHKKEDIYFKTTFFLYIITQIFPQIKYLQTSKIYLNKEQGFFILTINTLSIREIEFFAYIFFFDILKKDNKTIKKIH